MVQQSGLLVGKERTAAANDWQVLAQSAVTAPIIDAVAHRVVHGGDLFFDATLIDDTAVAQIEQWLPLAPAHLAGVAAFTLVCDVRPRPTSKPSTLSSVQFHSTAAATPYTAALSSIWRSKRWLLIIQGRPIAPNIHYCGYQQRVVCLLLGVCRATN